MVRESQAGPLGDSLAALVGRAALGAAVGALVLLTLGLAAELLRRQRRARRVLALLDLTLPLGVRTAVIALLAVAATLTGPRPVGASDSVRGWLRRSSTTTTTTRPTVATPDAISDRTVTPTTGVPTGPVVLIPPSTVENPGAPPAPPRTGAPATRPTVAAPAANVGVPPSPAHRNYVVAPGDCLWSIAAHLLGPRADARSIDTGWRRIYAANRAAIGDNPNLIHIGLTLELPPLDLQP